MYVSRLPTAPTTTTNNNRHLLLPSSSNRPNQRVRWHIRGVLLATVVPVVASVGVYDAFSRIDRQKLVCGGMYVCIPTPEHTHRSTTNCHQVKLREGVTHPGCTLGYYCRLYLLTCNRCTFRSLRCVIEDREAELGVRAHVCMYCMYPYSRLRPPRRSTTNCQQTYLREVAHAGCTLGYLYL